MKDIKFRIITLNNKSRKGDYIYIRDKDKRGYYKLKEGILIDPYINAFKKRKEYKSWHSALKSESNIIKEAMKDRIEWKKKNRDYNLSKIKRIEEYMKSGMNTIEYDLKHINNNERKVMEELLEPIILDKNIRSKIAEKSNYTRNKMWYKIEFEGVDYEGNNRYLGNLNIRGLSLKEVTNILTREVPKVFGYETISNLKKRLKCEGENGVTRDMGSFKLNRTKVGLTITSKGRKK